ncbi:MAG: lipid-transfer protein [Burkholderiales bacterium]
MTTDVYVMGVGMVPFTKPGRGDPYDVMGAAAVRAALDDAGIDYRQVQQAYAGFLYADTCAGQLVLYPLGLSGIPVINVNNACASGSTALFLARQAVASWAADCVLALGFEQMNPGGLGLVFKDRPSAAGLFRAELERTHGYDRSQIATPQYYAAAARDYMAEFGVGADLFGRISVKARRHGSKNPLAVFRDELTLEQVMGSTMVFAPLTKLQCCPPTCGAAAALVVSGEFLRRHGRGPRVRIAGQAMVTDLPSTFDSGDMRVVMGADLAATAAAAVYEQAGVGPDDVDVVELHDSFTPGELLNYESLGLTPRGTAEKFVLDGDNTYGGKVVVNPSGGLLSKGHPIGATGLAQCAELVWQLRGQAGARQVEGARLALQHNHGLGSACVVTMYEAVA